MPCIVSYTYIPVMRRRFAGVDLYNWNGEKDIESPPTYSERTRETNSPAVARDWLLGPRAAKTI